MKDTMTREEAERAGLVPYPPDPSTGGVYSMDIKKAVRLGLVPVPCSETNTRYGLMSLEARLSLIRRECGLA